MKSRGHRRAEHKRGNPEAPTIIYGWQSVLAAIKNPRRRVRKLLATGNALQRLAELGIAGLPEPAEPRDIDRLAGAGAVHQGLALLADPLPETDLMDLEDS